MRIDQFNNSTPVAPAVADRVAAARNVGGTFQNYFLPAETLSATGCQVTAAAGTSQGTATALTGFTAVVTSGTGGVLLPTPIEPTLAMIVNRSGGSINVYPPASQNFEALSANTPETIANGASGRALYTGGMQWYWV